MGETKKSPFANQRSSSWVCVKFQSSRAWTSLFDKRFLVFEVELRQLLFP